MVGVVRTCKTAALKYQNDSGAKGLQLYLQDLCLPVYSHTRALFFHVLT